MGPLGTPELVAIFILALLLFGPKELPKIGKTIGKAMTEFRRAQTELKSTFDREMKNLERETGIKELAASALQADSYNYDNSAYDYDASYYNSTATNTPANGASAIQGAGSTAPLQVEGAAGSIASGQLDSGYGEHAWDPYSPAEAASAEHGDSAGAKADEKAGAA
jgi:sec-independent protein translocase protein TatA